MARELEWWEPAWDAMRGPHGRRLLQLVVVLLLVGWGWQRCHVDWPAHPPVGEPPFQSAVEPDADPWEFRGYQLRPLATFEVQGLVVGRERYGTGRDAELSRYDIGVVWGALAAREQLERLTFRQYGRFLNWRTKQELLLSMDEINQSMANIHTIAPDRATLRKLKRLRPGQVVRLRGILVEVTAADGFIWRSSLRRDDTGWGACEVLWVQDVQRIPVP